MPTHKLADHGEIEIRPQRLVRDGGTRSLFGSRGRALVDGYNIGACADAIVAASVAATPPDTT